MGCWLECQPNRIQSRLFLWEHEGIERGVRFDEILTHRSPHLMTGRLGWRTDRMGGGKRYDICWWCWWWWWQCDDGGGGVECWGAMPVLRWIKSPVERGSIRSKIHYLLYMYRIAGGGGRLAWRRRRLLLIAVLMGTWIGIGVRPGCTIAV